jgi:hypothetical protein
MTNTDSGVYLVASTEPGTGAVTGVVQNPGPIVGLRVTATSRDRRLPVLRLSTVTDVAGSFSFINLPAAADGSCFLITAHARNLVFLRYATLIRRSTYEWTLDLGGRHSLVDTDSDRCKL